MQCDTPRTKRWEIPNLVCNAVKKTSKDMQKKRMIRWVNNKVPTFDFTCVRCEEEGKLERMIVKVWSCNLFKILS
jgi:ribosomal protein L37AE/L43A